MKKSELRQIIREEIQKSNEVSKYDILKKKYPKEVKKYKKAMNYQVMAVEYDALYNVLVLGKPSKYELTRKHEQNVKRILGIE